jgi:hypothetical protein
MDALAGPAHVSNFLPIVFLFFVFISFFFPV